MSGVYGDLSLMGVSDILQWCEMSQKTGTLSVKKEDVKKRFYIQNGKIIYVSSNKDEECLERQLVQCNIVSSSEIDNLLRVCHRMGLPLTGYIISKKIATFEAIESILRQIVEKALLDVLKWTEGVFQFVDEVPDEIIDSPVKLDVSFMLLQSLKVLDESRKNDSDDETERVQKLLDKISDGKINLPPVPDIVIKLREALDRDDVSLSEVVKTIMSDQILTLKILKIANSALYAKHEKITSLQQAVVYFGLNSLISIATIHALSNIVPKNASRVKMVLNHCLLTGLIARLLAPYCAEDPEEAFVCGLLHDVGKTVLLENLTPLRLNESHFEKIIDEYHPVAGLRLAERWNFSEVIKSVIRFHHAPDTDKTHFKILNLISLADRIAHNLHRQEVIEEELSKIETSSLCSKRFNRENLLKELKRLEQETSLFA